MIDFILINKFEIQNSYNDRNYIKSHNDINYDDINNNNNNNNNKNKNYYNNNNNNINYNKND